MSSQTTYNSWEIDTTLGMFRKHQKLLKTCRELSMLATLKTQVSQKLWLWEIVWKTCLRSRSLLRPTCPVFPIFSLFIQSTIVLDLGKWFFAHHHVFHFSYFFLEYLHIKCLDWQKSWMTRNGTEIGSFHRWFFVISYLSVMLWRKWSRTIKSWTWSTGSRPASSLIFYLVSAATNPNPICFDIFTFCRLSRCLGNVAYSCLTFDRVLYEPIFELFLLA